MKKQIIQKELMRSILLNPGPATTSIRVKQALLQVDICPREKEFGDLVLNVLSKIKQVVNARADYGSVLVPGPGTAAIESSLLHLADDHKKILIIENGAYGLRMQEICEIYQLPYQKLSFPWDQAIDLDILENFIAVHKESLASMAFVHHETTSGLINPLPEISALAQKFQLKLLVDGMSSYAGVAIDLNVNPVDYFISSSNKCIQGMAGLGFIIYRQSVLDQKKTRRTLSLDLAANAQSQNKKKEFLFTGPVQILYALDEALNEFFDEGPHKRYQRYADLYLKMRNGMLELGFNELIESTKHSKILTTFLLPKNSSFNFDDYHDFLFARGITIYPGKIPQIDSFRISNIGELNLEDIETFLKLTSEYLKEFKIDVLY